MTNKGVSNKYKLKTKTGDVTLHGLRIGFIQASPYNPNVCAYIEINTYTDRPKITGIHPKTRELIDKDFNSIKDARKFLRDLKP